MFADIELAHMNIERQQGGVEVVIPILPHGCSEAKIVQLQRLLIDRLIADQNVGDFIAWYYTPMALLFTWTSEPGSDGVRLHGSAFRLPGRTAGNGGAGTTVVQKG